MADEIKIGDKVRDKVIGFFYRKVQGHSEGVVMGSSACPHALRNTYGECYKCSHKKTYSVTLNSGRFAVRYHCELEKVLDPIKLKLTTRKFRIHG